MRGKLARGRGLGWRQRGFNEARALCAGNFPCAGIAAGLSNASMRPALYARETSRQSGCQLDSVQLQ